MIDASRLSHSLATALKDRPHGIPVQPNRSLPLRPPPPPPVRISVTKSPKSSPLTSINPQEVKNSENLAERTSVDQNGCTEDGNSRNGNDPPSLGVVGMNFYDSQERTDETNRIPDPSSRKVPDEVHKSRHSKSLDHEESGQRSCAENRRKSFECETISRHGHNENRNSCSSDSASPEAKSPKEKKRRGSYAKKRKSSSVEDNSDGSRKEKSPKLQKIDSQESPKSKSWNHDGVKSSGSGLPTIYRTGTAKRRNSESPRTKVEGINASSKVSEAAGNGNWIKIGLNSYKLILPKPPPSIPKCPVAIPIDVAHAIHMNGTTNLNNKWEAEGAEIPLTKQHDSMKPKTNTVQNGTHIPKSVEDLENTLPSMPSLDLDLQNEILNGNSTENAARQPEAKLSQGTDDILSKTNQLTANEPIQGYPISAHDHNFNFTTVLQEITIMTASEVMPNGNVAGMPDKSPIEATIPELNDKGQQYQDLSGRDQLRYILQSENRLEDEGGFGDSFCVSQRQEIGQKCGRDDSIADKTEGIRKESQPRSKVDPDIVKGRRIKRLAKLQKLEEEEIHLRRKMAQTTDPSRITRLQQRLNCNLKKAENTRKYLDKLPSIENLSISTSHPNPPPLRIQVRQDLVEIPSSTETVEPVRRSPFVPCSDRDTVIARSLTASSPLVITISESDSGSSDDETDTADEKLSENVQPAIQTYPDLKIELKAELKNELKNELMLELQNELKYESKNESENELKNIPTNVVKHSSDLLLKNDYRTNDFPYTSIPPDVEVKLVSAIKEPETTTNNIKYTGKNLPSVGDGVPVAGNDALTSLPPLVRDPITYSPTCLGRFANQKSPSTQYRAENSNSAPKRIQKEQIKQNCSCLDCLRGILVVPVQNTKRNNYIPSSVDNLTTSQENININTQPVTNYPGHQTDYRTTGNVTSVFSRDNGGANINLSSPLQGHSPLPLPQSYHRNLTAQGYPMPGERSPNHQTTQWQNQHPGIKLPVPFTPDPGGTPHASILATHLLKSQAQEPVNFNRSPQLPNPMIEQFPTLGDWAAQMTRETTRKPVKNPTAPQINSDSLSKHPTGPKTTGSDMYKMTASAIDARHPAAGSANGLQWPPVRPWPEQQRPAQSFPAPRSNPPQHGRDYPANPQNPNPNCYIAQPGYQGGTVYVPAASHLYLQTPSVPQIARNTEYSGVPQNQQQQYYSHGLATQPSVPSTYQNQSQGHTAHTVNSLAMMQRKYIQPPTYTTPALFAQWPQSSINYSKQYPSMQYNGYSIQPKQTDNSRYTTARPKNKNIAPRQPVQPLQPILPLQPLQPLQPVQPLHQQREHFIQNISSAKLPRDIHNGRAVIRQRVPGDGINEPIDLGRRSGNQQPVVPQNIPDSRLNNSNCSMCGKSGPMFNCIGCENAFYCNQNCQTQHWDTHVSECSQKMPKLKKVS